MNLILLHKFFSLIIVFTSCFLGFIVYASNKQKKSNKFFCLMSIHVSLWIFFYYLTITAQDITKILQWSKLAYASVSIFYLFFYFFFIYFLELEKKLKILNIFIFFISIYFFITSLFTDWIVKNAILQNGKMDLLLGTGSKGFYGMAMFLSIFILGLLLLKYFKLPEKEKIKIQYFLIGVSLWLLMNFIFNMFLPLWRGSVKFAEFGNYSAIFLLGFTAFAIVKRDLFDIKIVLTALLVGLIAILLLFDALIFTQESSLQIVKGIIFIIFLFFGRYLIKSVQLEIKRREELENLTSQLKIANVKLRLAYKKMERLDKAKSEFISIASHQLRTPLSAIKGYLSMVLEKSYGKWPEKMKRPLENVYTSNERLIKLVNDLLSISRIEAGKIELEPEKASVQEIVSGIIDELKVITEKKNIYLRIEKSKKPLPKILIDKNKLRQVVINVIDNAIRYTEKGGITVKFEIESSNFKIIISDTGEGMSKEEISKLFETFSRGKAGARFWTEGAGLGLYIAKKFIEMHKGKIWAESKGKDKGSVFYIKLPL